MYRRTTNVVACGAIALAATAIAPSARAYCRTTTAPPPADFDSSEACWEQGKPLFWKNACVSFSIQKANGKQITAEKVGALLAQSFSTWTSASCTGNAHPSIEVKQLASTTVETVGYNSGAPNVNLVVMRDSNWPHQNSGDSLALTTLTFDAASGEIFDADIEINTADNKFAVADPVPSDGLDLRTVLMHQVGHFLGFAHSPEPKSPMFMAYTPGSTEGRALSLDDVAAICDVYAPGGERKSAAGPVRAETCDPTPRGGLELTPNPPPSDGCATAPDAPSSGIAVAALTALALVEAHRRARRKQLNARP
jgi:MYXO-CTERM domain-containing protein